MYSPSARNYCSVYTKQKHRKEKALAYICFNITIFWMDSKPSLWHYADINGLTKTGCHERDTVCLCEGVFDTIVFVWLPLWLHWSLSLWYSLAGGDENRSGWKPSGKKKKKKAGMLHLCGAQGRLCWCWGHRRFRCYTLSRRVYQP